MENIKVSNLSEKDINDISGGSCSFAYDVGTIIRWTFKHGPFPNPTELTADMIQYHINCN